MNMTAKSVEAMSGEVARDALITRDVDLSAKLKNDGLEQKGLNL